MIIGWYDIRLTGNLEDVLEGAGVDYRKIRTPELYKQLDPFLCNSAMEVPVNKEQLRQLQGYDRENEKNLLFFDDDSFLM